MKSLLALVLMLGFLAPPTAIAQSGDAGEVSVDLELFGVGGVVRPGDWGGVRLALRDAGVEVRPVRVVLEFVDADGDTVRWEREATLNPGGAQGVWLFARFPFSLRAGQAVRVRVSDDDGEIA